jgi:oligopeptide transport system ATP-binding protein
MKICLRREPPQIDLGDGHTAACWLLADEAKRLAKKEETPNE